MVKFFRISTVLVIIVIASGQEISPAQVQITGAGANKTNGATIAEDLVEPVETIEIQGEGDTQTEQQRLESQNQSPQQGEGDTQTEQQRLESQNQAPQQYQNMVQELMQEVREQHNDLLDSSTSNSQSEKPGESQDLLDPSTGNSQGEKPGETQDLLDQNVATEVSQPSLDKIEQENASSKQIIVDGMTISEEDKVLDQQNFETHYDNALNGLSEVVEHNLEKQEELEDVIYNETKSHEDNGDNQMALENNTITVQNDRDATIEQDQEVEVLEADYMTTSSPFFTTTNPFTTTYSTTTPYYSTSSTPTIGPHSSTSPPSTMDFSRPRVAVADRVRVENINAGYNIVKENAENEYVKEIQSIEKEKNIEESWEDAIATTQVIAFILIAMVAVVVIYVLYVARKKVCKKMREYSSNARYNTSNKWKEEKEYRNLLQEDPDSDQEKGTRGIPTKR